MSFARKPLVIGITILTPLVLAVLYLTVIFHELPERVPVQWGIHGEPRAWMTKQGYAVYLTCFVGLINGVLLIARWTPPRLVRFPHKKEWLASPHLIDELRKRLRTMLAAAMVLVNWSTLFAVHLVASQSVPERVALPLLSVEPFTLGVLAATGVFLLWLYVRMQPPEHTAVAQAQDGG